VGLHYLFTFYSGYKAVAKNSQNIQSILSSRLLSRNVKVKIYKNIILTAVLYGCETWSLAVREEHRLRENGVQRRIFGPKRDEVTGEWRKLHNEELRMLYSSPNIIRQIKSRRMRWAGHVARMGEERKVYRILVGETETTWKTKAWMGGWAQKESWGDWVEEFRVDPVSSGQGPVAGSCKYGDEPAGSGATDLVTTLVTWFTLRELSVM
jgi:hypothetical protein